MNIDHAFIMCAGFGSRMGRIGEILPKPLWPVFDISILELQIQYAQKLNIKNIFINSHHLHEKMNFKFTSLKQKYSNIHLIHEPELLGSGGGVHNFCRHELVNYKGTAVYLSGDQFLFFDSHLFSNIEKIKNSFGSCLVAIDITGETGYNRLVVEGDKLVKIEKDYDINEKSMTYSGMGFIDLKTLKPSVGKSSFFDTVCDFQNNQVGVFDVPNPEYWDFGTTERYFESCFRLLNEAQNRNGKIFSYFKYDEIFDSRKINFDQFSYRCGQKKSILNFSANEEMNISNSSDLIILSSNENQIIEKKHRSILFNEDENLV